MLQSKFESIHRNLTTIARKVYEFVPIQEAWDCSQVCGEMRRQGVSNDLRLVAGCLNSLAHDIDTTAIELAESAQRSDADAKKLRQLQALLKGLT